MSLCLPSLRSSKGCSLRQIVEKFFVILNEVKDLISSD